MPPTSLVLALPLGWLRETDSIWACALFHENTRQPTS